MQYYYASETGGGREAPAGGGGRRRDITFGYGETNSCSVPGVAID